MYSRAARVTELSSGSTNDSVGPGAYNIDNSKNTKQDSYAPFMSLCSRSSMFESKEFSPGPGQYDIAASKIPVPGGQSLQNHSRRFEEFESYAPGPGAYNITQTHKPSPQRKNKRVKTVFPSSGVPSIPCPGQAFGFEENKHGVLCRHPPPNTDHTIGPAFYCPKQIEQQCKGVPFSRMTEKRADLKIVEGPGPGHYCPEQNHSVLYENVNLKRDLNCRAELQVPRYHEILAMKEEKNGVPGPGQYDVKGQFEKFSDSHSATSRAPFMSHTPRFTFVKDVAPPVGCYHDPRSALETVKKPTGNKTRPFNLTAARFISDTRTHSTPGPGAYDVFDLGMAQESMKKVCVERGRKAAFGSTEKRKLQFINKQQSTPGPAHYTVEKEGEIFYKQKPTAAFRSNTDRLSTPAKVSPPASCYNVREAFEAVSGRRQTSKPCTDAARKRQNSFLTSAPRDSAFLCQDTQLPGPGQYTPEVNSTPKLALIASRSDRFKEFKNTTPGPGTYTLSPAVLDTVLKGTFNVTLQNPLMSHVQAPAPQVTMATNFTISSV
ncbi:sperm-tail PG-rich repeat-containing protein 2-like [Hoplias malabaricus]|uniref:sperm-tail PG-rich repeat-containing protein 2-like n=1 Tax=Hoplias malabaricus TaxID=27720 RepID=UPI003461CFED